MNTFATNDYTLENKTQEHKFEILSNYEEVHSPSTDYTDADCDVNRREEFYLTEVAALEPLVENMPQFLLDSNCESDFKTFNTELKINWEHKTPAKVARKISAETLAASEEEEEEEEELKGWTEKKDKTLKNLASKCKYDWKKIAKKFNASEETNYTPVELKQKYKDLNKVSIPLRVKFSHEEDLMIAKYYDIYGCDWVQIATFFTDRTAIMLKNRYYSHIRKRNLLTSMLEEIKFTGEEEVTAECTMEEVTEEVQSDSENYQRNFSMTQVHSIFFEVENALASQLYDRITVSYM